MSLFGAPFVIDFTTLYCKPFPSAETHNGLPVRHAWKMDNKTKGKDYIIFAKSPEVKSKWMDAFRREKERVAQDKASGIADSGSGVHQGSHAPSVCAGFSVSLKMKRAAAALCSSTTAAVSAAKRRKSFNKKQVLRVTGKYCLWCCIFFYVLALVMVMRVQFGS